MSFHIPQQTAGHDLFALQKTHFKYVKIIYRILELNYIPQNTRAINVYVFLRGSKVLSTVRQDLR